MKQFISILMIVGMLTITYQSYTYDYAQPFFASARGISSTLATAGVLNCIARCFLNNGRWWIPTPFYVGGVLGWFMLGKITVNETVTHNTENTVTHSNENYEVIIGPQNEIKNKGEKKAYELSVLATIIAIVGSYYNTGGFQ